MSGISPIRNVGGLLGFDLPSGERLHFAMERSPFLMGKSTISTGPFSIAMLVHQRVIGFNVV